MLCSFERLFGWVSELFIRLYCITYCGFGIFQYLFNLNTSVGLRFSGGLPQATHTLSLSNAYQTLGGTFSKSFCECEVHICSILNY